MKISGKTALITGGASGLGLETAKSLASKGCNVVILDVNEAGGQEAAAELGEKCLFVNVDVSNAEAVRAGVEKGIEKFGAIHILVCCAAIMYVEKIYSKKRGLCNISGYKKTMNINLDGTFYAVREAVGRMVNNEPDAQGERGVIIMTASCAGHQAASGQIAYAASKGAILSMTLPMTRELSAFGIRVMTISPGPFDTSMFHGGTDKEWEAKTYNEIPFPKRAGYPAEYTHLVEEIVSNSFLNGTDIMIDGGYRQAY